MSGKRNYLSVFCCAIFFLIAFVSVNHAFGQTNASSPGDLTSTNAVANPAVTAQSTGVALAMTLIPVIVPLLIALSKFIIPKLPTWTLPIIAPILGEILNLISTKTGVGGVGPINAALLGAAGVGVREIYDQVQDRAKNGPAMAAAILIFFGIGVAGLATGCGHKTLENGGAYAPGKKVVTLDASGATVTNFIPSAMPDYDFFVVDSAFDLAYSTIDAAFTFERDNRAFLWQISPSIKHALDNIRPTANQVRVGYSQARQKYMANPIPANLTQLQTYLAQIQSAASAAQTAIATAKRSSPPVPAK